jgi:hypothetical protein
VKMARHPTAVSSPMSPEYGPNIAKDYYNVALSAQHTKDGSYVA